MAPLWIKITHWTPDKPEVFCVAELLKIDPDAVIGKLVRVWIWADQQIEDCCALSVTKASLDRIACVTGFSDALEKVGWLEQNKDGLVFSNFDRHNGATAKKRALAAKRMEKRRGSCAASVTKSEHKANKSCAASVTKSSPDRDEDRDEEIKRPPTPLQGEAACAADLAADELKPVDPVDRISGSALEFVRDSWNASGPITCIRLTEKLRRAARARLNVPWWSEHWLLALEKLPQCRFLQGDSERGWRADLEWFLKPDSVQKILEGKYDHVGSAETNPREQSALNRSLDALAKFAASDPAGSGEGSGPPLRIEADGGIR